MRLTPKYSYFKHLFAQRGCFTLYLVCELDYSNEQSFYRKELPKNFVLVGLITIYGGGDKKLFEKKKWSFWGLLQQAKQHFWIKCHLKNPFFGCGHKTHPLLSN